MKTIIRILPLLFILIISSIIITNCNGDSNNSTQKPTKKINGFYYSFDETGSVIVDNSGNNYDGTPSSISRVPGKVGNAVKFLGLGSTIDLDIVYYFPFNTGISFRAWIKTDQIITTKQQIIGSSTSNLASTVNNFGISLINDSISFEVPAQQNIVSVTTAPLSFPLNTWFHIAITYDGDAINFYYNGNLVATNSILTTFEPSFYNQIGNNQKVYSGIHIEDQFLGYMDELYLENKILSQSEIATYYRNTM